MDAVFLRIVSDFEIRVSRFKVSFRRLRARLRLPNVFRF